MGSYRDCREEEGADVKCVSKAVVRNAITNCASPAMIKRLKSEYVINAIHGSECIIVSV